MIVIALIEWFWTAVAVFGVGACVWSLIDSYVDRRTLKKRNVNGDAQQMVNINLRSTRASLMLHAFFLLLGVLALKSPDKGEVTFAFVFFGLCYIGVASINVRAVLLNQIDRVRMRNR